MSSDFLKAAKGITLGQLAADPVDGINGDLYYNTTSNKFRKFQAGIWENMDITGSGALFTDKISLRKAIEVIVASTANVVLATGADNGSVINGVTLLTGDLILLKNQTLSQDNGVYVVQASGAPVRYSLADTAAEMYELVAYARFGTVAPRTAYFQTLVVANLATDPQNWSTSIPAVNWTVPTDVFKIFLKVTAGGGGGGGGGAIASPTFFGTGGAAGGSGVVTEIWAYDVEPGQVIIIQRGLGGAGGVSGTGSNAGANGDIGGNTIIQFPSGHTLTIQGANGGDGSVGGPSGFHVGATGNPATFGYPSINTASGNGGNSTTTNGGSNSTVGTAGQSSKFAAGGAPGVRTNVRSGTGGGGGAGIGQGGAGGDSRGTGSDVVRTAYGFAGVDGAGGGGGGGWGGGGGGGGGPGGIGGRGGDGSVEFFYWV